MTGSPVAGPSRCVAPVGMRLMADRIQARAIKRCGELLEEIKPQHTGRPPKLGEAPPPITRTSAARDAGMSDDQRKQALDCIRPYTRIARDCIA